jgi:hypothetical protein
MAPRLHLELGSGSDEYSRGTSSSRGSFQSRTQRKEMRTLSEGVGVLPATNMYSYVGRSLWKEMRVISEV